MRYAKYINEHEVQFPPLSKIVNGKMVIGYANRIDLLEADGYKPYSEAEPPVIEGMVVSGYHYEVSDGFVRKVYDYEPKVPQDAIDTTEAIIRRIAAVVVAYDAVEDVKQLEDVNINSLLALAAEKGVTDEDMMKLKGDIVMLKTDLEGKMQGTWYEIWHGWLKEAITKAMRELEALSTSQTAEGGDVDTEAEEIENP